MNDQNMQGSFVPPQDDGKALSIAALVLGIVSCAAAWFGWGTILGLVTGIVGLICATNGRKKAMAAGAPTGLGTAGLVLSIVGTVISGILFVSCTLCICATGCATGCARSYFNAFAGNRYY